MYLTFVDGVLGLYLANYFLIQTSAIAVFRAVCSFFIFFLFFFFKKKIIMVMVGRN
jgi:uncharacterized membrane protein